MSNPIKDAWICEKHYKELCDKLGHEVPIMPIYNILLNK